MTDTNHFYNLINCIKLKYLHVCDGKVSIFLLVTQAVSRFYHVFLFSFIPFFIFFISREVGNQGRTQARLRPSRHHIIVLRVK